MSGTKNKNFSYQVMTINLIVIIILFLPILLISNKYLNSNTVKNKYLKQKKKEEKLSTKTFQQRSLIVRNFFASLDIESSHIWWKKRKIKDPHKYLLPIILSQLSVQNELNSQKINEERLWEILLELDKYRPIPYHFRSYLDTRIFFLFKDRMPENLLKTYKSQLHKPKVLSWLNPGTENHMFMQRSSGLSLMDSEGLSSEYLAIKSTIEAWLLSEKNKILTIGQGEFHSSTYYGYSIGGLLNLFDFAKTPELKKLAKEILDFYALNMALRLSWGTAGGAESRGYDRNTWNSGLTAVAWIWWGDNIQLPNNISKSSIRLALAPALSSYRPPKYLKSIALKRNRLPFTFSTTHPDYYSYFKGKKFFETFYVTENYSLGTLLNTSRNYKRKGTINKQYATYKLVVKNKPENDVISLSGAYHGNQGVGRSPGDQYAQEKGTVIYQLILNRKDLEMGVPPKSNLVVPIKYGEPFKYNSWYIWRISQIWFCARPFGSKITYEKSVNYKNKKYQIVTVHGNKNAWITDIANVSDYSNIEDLKISLNKRNINHKLWDSQGTISYNSFLKDTIEMTYEENKMLPNIIINGNKKSIKNWENKEILQKLKMTVE